MARSFGLNFCHNVAMNTYINDWARRRNKNSILIEGKVSIRQTEHVGCGRGACRTCASTRRHELNTRSVWYGTLRYGSSAVSVGLVGECAVGAVFGLLGCFRPGVLGLGCLQPGRPSGLGAWPGQPLAGHSKFFLKKILKYLFFCYQNPSKF